MNFSTPRCNVSGSIRFKKLILKGDLQTAMDVAKQQVKRIPVHKTRTRTPQPDLQSCRTHQRLEAHWKFLEICCCWSVLLLVLHPGLGAGRLRTKSCSVVALLMCPYSIHGALSRPSFTEGRRLSFVPDWSVFGIPPILGGAFLLPVLDTA